MVEDLATSIKKSLPASAIGLVVAMWLAYFLNYCDRQAVFSMFPALRRDLGMSDQQLGMTGAIFLWVYGIGSLLAGWAADRWCRRRMVVGSLAIWSLVTLATGAAASGTMLLALRGLMGISEALFMPAAIAMTASAVPPSYRSRAIASLTTAQIAGSVAGSWFGGWMTEQRQWRMAFYSMGLALCPPLPLGPRKGKAAQRSHCKSFLVAGLLPAAPVDPDLLHALHHLSDLRLWTLDALQLDP
jgi:MFS family permease